MTNTLVNMDDYLFEILFSILWVYTQKWNWWINMITLFLVFRGTVILVFIVAIWLDIPTNIIQMFLFLYILTNVYLIIFLNSSHPTECETVPYCGFTFVCFTWTLCCSGWPQSLGLKLSSCLSLTEKQACTSYYTQLLLWFWFVFPW